MGKLFSPLTIRGVTLANRIVVSPMCQYCAEGGKATSWHAAHLGQLAVSGAGMLCIESTSVEPAGRITQVISVCGTMKPKRRSRPCCAK